MPLHAVSDTGPVELSHQPNGTLGLSQRAVERLARLGHQKTLAEGDILFREGDAARSIYLVRSGLLEISVLAPTGRRMILNYTGPGSLIGEIAVFTPGGRTATACSVRQSVIDAIPAEQFRQFVCADPALSDGMMQLIASRLRWVSDQLRERTELPVRVRAARWLLKLLAAEGEVAGSSSVGTVGQALRVSQGELADAVGATRETVTRLLGEWRSNGWLVIGHRAIFVVDREAIEALAGEDLPSVRTRQTSA